MSLRLALPKGLEQTSQKDLLKKLIKAIQDATKKHSKYLNNHKTNHSFCDRSTSKKPISKQDQVKLLHEQASSNPNDSLASPN